MNLKKTIKNIHLCKLHYFNMVDENFPFGEVVDSDLGSLVIIGQPRAMKKNIAKVGTNLKVINNYKYFCKSNKPTRDFFYNIYGISFCKEELKVCRYLHQHEIYFSTL
jgi:hypothetical protein